MRCKCFIFNDLGPVLALDTEPLSERYFTIKSVKVLLCVTSIHSGSYVQISTPSEIVLNSSVSYRVKHVGRLLE
jgi:hypothetical protein